MNVYGYMRQVPNYEDYHLCPPASKILTCPSESQFCGFNERSLRHAHLDIRSQKV